ncbi:hypothetical protein J6590_047897 [Homalodisca vitripennis]|nr:hypothetical protein J6590_047897 [Homalodisca vitripennis]
MFKFEAVFMTSTFQGHRKFSYGTGADFYEPYSIGKRGSESNAAILSESRSPHRVHRRTEVEEWPRYRGWRRYRHVRCTYYLDCIAVGRNVFKYDMTSQIESTEHKQPQRFEDGDEVANYCFYSLGCQISDIYDECYMAVIGRQGRGNPSSRLRLPARPPLPPTHPGSSCR